MGISICWDNPEKTIIRYDFGESWTWDDFWAVLRADDELINSVSHTVHLILDFRKTRFVPPNPGSKFRTVADQISERIGIIVIVGANAWFLSVSEMFLKLYGSKIKGIAAVKTVLSMEEARSIIGGYQRTGV